VLIVSSLSTRSLSQPVLIADTSSRRRSKRIRPLGLVAHCRCRLASHTASKPLRTHTSST